MADRRDAKIIEDLKNNLLECAVCLSPYQFPKMLICKHSFCKRCIEACVEHSAVKCPLCRTVTQLTRPGNVDQLPEDLTIRGLINMLKKKKAEEKKTCITNNGGSNVRRPLGEVTNIARKSVAKKSVRPAWR